MKPGPPEGNQFKTGCYLITDGTDYLEVGYGKRRVYHDSAEHLVVYVPVQMFHQLSVGESNVGLQDHKSYLCVPAAQTLFRQTCGFCHTLKMGTLNEACQAHSHENSCDIFPEHQIL